MPVVGGVREHLLRLQRRHAIPVIVVPALGTVALLALRWNPTPARVGLFAAFAFVSLLGVTVGFHRLLGHGAFSCAPAVRTVLAAMGCLAAEGPPIFWVANHRLHHQRSDEDGDPHSPRNLGRGALGALRAFWHAHAGWMLTELPADPLRYAPDLLKDRAVARVNRRYRWIVVGGLLAPAAIGLVAWGPMGFVDGLLWGGLGRLFVVQHITWCINSVCHLAGTRPFQTGDGSRNNPLLGLIGLGEGWHNNHHAAPSSAAHGLAWWQIDISYAVIRLLRVCGLARDVRVADAVSLRRAGVDRVQ